MKLLIATGNAGKIREVAAALGSVASVVSPADFPAAAPDVVEDGTTYFENALKKAVAYHRVYGVPALSDDSGLEVDALGGEPGIHSARYGGEPGIHSARYGGELSWPDRCARLQGAIPPGAARSARFRCVLCYFDGVLPVFFQGTVEGEITADSRGMEGFGYDPVFYCPELGKTFGEASLEEKQRVSHRGVALGAFREWVKTLRGEQGA